MADAVLSQSQTLDVQVNTFDPASTQPDYPQILMQCQKEMLSNIELTFKKNLAAFREFEPDLFQRIKSYGFRQQLQFICTSNCVPNLFFLQSNSFLYPAFDPIEYCDKQVELYLHNKPCLQTYFAEEKEKLGQIHFRYINHLLRYQRANLPSQVTLANTQACPCMMVHGVGLGYHIARLYESVEVGSLLITEPDFDLFYASLHTFDWDNLLRYINAEPTREIKFFIGLSNEDFEGQLTAFYQQERNVLSDFYWSLKHYSSKAINNYEQISTNLFKKLNSNIGFFDSRLFALSQSMANVAQQSSLVRQLKCRLDVPEHILKLNHLTSTLNLPESLRDTPICVVANGPSLSDDLAFLRKIQDHVLILACGTALETLYNAGIQPHFYAAIERLKQISDVISLIPDRNYLNNIILLTTDNIHPETVKLFKHHALFLKPEEPFSDILSYQNPDLSYELENIYCTNPLVGNMGLAAAATLGFKNIYMFGVDNGSAREDKRQHPTESVTYTKIFSDSQQNVADEDQEVNELNLEQPGNFTDKVYTNLLYNSSAFTMEVLIENNTDLNFFNCSNGRKIKGAQPTHSHTLLDAWLKLPQANVDLLFNSFEQELTQKLPLNMDTLVTWCDKPLFNHIVLACFKILGIETEETKDFNFAQLPHAHDNVESQLSSLYECTLPSFNSRLEVMQVLYKLNGLLKELENNPRTKALLCFFNGSIMNFCTLTMRCMYLSDNEQVALQRASEHLQTLAYFLDDARHLYVKFAPFYCDHQHRECLQGKIGFDHKNMSTPDVPEYVQYVTQKDRDMYPIKIFKKRYE